MRTSSLLAIIIAMSACRSSKDLSGETKNAGRQKVLSGMELTAVYIDALPRYGHDGEKWDAWAPFAEEPDVYFRLSQFDAVVYQSGVKEESDYNKRLEFVQNLPLTFMTYTQPVLIEIFDEDGVSSDDNIGYFSFNPLDHLKKSKVVLMNSEGTLKVTLDIRWIYKEGY